ncbi:MAG: hypothetical protein DMD44_02365 [Gemmatimonadetes bacterium]|nr:MAG: hypothetical protein DMD44_02365 [Gemmatimonadota bacterium]
MVLAVVAMGACQKAEQKPAAAAADTSHNMMQMSSDTSKMPMADTSKHMMMADTAKKMAPAAKPATKSGANRAPKKKP